MVFSYFFLPSAYPDPLYFVFQLCYRTDEAPAWKAVVCDALFSFSQQDEQEYKGKKCQKMIVSPPGCF